MTPTEKLLINQYGVLLTMQECAALFDRSVEGLRVSLGTDTELSRKLRPARVKIGRRVLFKAAELARLLDEA